MTDQDPTPRYVGFDDGGAGRRDYGPKGCAGLVLAPVVLVATVLLLVFGVWS